MLSQPPRRLLLALGLAPLLGACAHVPPSAASGMHAALRPYAAGTVHGVLQLRADGGSVTITGEVVGLRPGGHHGIHVHLNGDCSGTDGSAAGPHFNPGGAAHGDPASTAHLGDLGNLVADSRGVATVDIVRPGASLAPGEHSFAGHSIVVHADADDLHSQPAGNSGARVACGVIVAGS